MRWIVFLARLLSLCAFGPAYGQSNAAPELVVTLAPQQIQAQLLEGAQFEFAVRNNSSRPVAVLTWDTPLRGPADVFLVLCNGHLASYIGPDFKRSEPVAEDYVRLLPGQAVSVNIDIGEAYALEPGTCSVTFDSSLMTVLAADGSRSQVKANVLANLASVSVPEGPRPSRRHDVNPTVLSSTTPSITSCDAKTQEPVLKAALGNARTMALQAINTLNSTPANALPTAKRYLHWFGAYEPGNYATAIAHFNAINDALTNKPLSIDCGGWWCSSGDFAYVYSWDPYTIYPCSGFWTAKPLGYNSQAGTLIHEVSHFNVVADTDDVRNDVCTAGSGHKCYGGQNAAALAQKDPSLALTNADNHEFYAENTPPE